MTVPCEAGPRFTDPLGDTGAITVPGVLKDVGQCGVYAGSLDPSCWPHHRAV